MAGSNGALARCVRQILVADSIGRRGGDCIIGEERYHLYSWTEALEYRNFGENMQPESRFAAAAGRGVASRR